MEPDAALRQKQRHLAEVQRFKMQAIKAEERFLEARKMARKAGCTEQEIATAISTAEGAMR